MRGPATAAAAASPSSARNTGPKAAPAAATAGEPVLLELQLGRIASRTVEAYRYGDAALVPLGAFFDLAEIKSARRPDGVIEATIQPGNIPMTLDPVSRVLRVGKQKLVLSQDQMVATDRDVYLDTAVLARAFNL